METLTAGIPDQASVGLKSAAALSANCENANCDGLLEWENGDTFTYFGTFTKGSPTKPCNKLKPVTTGNELFTSGCDKTFEFIFSKPCP